MLDAVHRCSGQLAWRNLPTVLLAGWLDTNSSTCQCLQMCRALCGVAALLVWSALPSSCRSLPDILTARLQAAGLTQPAWQALLQQTCKALWGASLPQLGTTPRHLPQWRRRTHSPTRPPQSRAPAQAARPLPNVSPTATVAGAVESPLKAALGSTRCLRMGCQCRPPLQLGATWQRDLQGQAPSRHGVGRCAAWTPHAASDTAQWPR